MRFSKYSGAGNDFILIDNRSQAFVPALVPSLCHRQDGIGADGVILCDSSENNLFKIRIFNADGSLAEMCGNGIRCFTKFLRELGFVQENYSIQNIEGKLYITSFLHDQNQVCVKMAPVSHVKFHQTCHVNNQKVTLHSLNTGVPHAVIIVSNPDFVDVQNLGRAIRYHQDFQPQGTNANFISVDELGTVFVRTYERGVEDETLACGTGACAAAIVAATLHNLPTPIRVKVRSQDILTIDFKRHNDTFLDLTMTGPAKKVFEGTF